MEQVRAAISVVNMVDGRTDDGDDDGEAGCLWIAEEVALETWRQAQLVDAAKAISSQPHPDCAAADVHQLGWLMEKRFG
jgi:hypothetical protein